MKGERRRKGNLTSRENVSNCGCSRCFYHFSGISYPLSMHTLPPPSSFVPEFGNLSCMMLSNLYTIVFSQRHGRHHYVRHKVFSHCGVGEDTSLEILVGIGKDLCPIYFRVHSVSFPIPPARNQNEFQYSQERGGRKLSLLREAKPTR